MKFQKRNKGENKSYWINNLLHEINGLLKISYEQNLNMALVKESAVIKKYLSSIRTIKNNWFF